jgi:hypothetical protein
MLCPASAQTVAFPKVIPFHDGRLVGYEKATEIRNGPQALRPSCADCVFVTIKLEISKPFDYRRGMFRELSLIDDNNKIYQYRGLLMPQGWVALDDAKEVMPGESMMTFSADKYPKQVDIHFEVPAAANSLTLRVGDRTAVLWSPPARRTGQ